MFVALRHEAAQIVGPVGLLAKVRRLIRYRKVNGIQRQDPKIRQDLLQAVKECFAWLIGSRSKHLRSLFGAPCRFYCFSYLGLTLVPNQR